MDYYNGLCHHGIKGMKWGVRRYQNKDGSLTPAGKKRASKEYKKYAVKTQEDLAKNYNKRYVNAYNKAAEDMNNGLTEKYNSDYAKKLGTKAEGHNYFEDSDYHRGYEKMFDEVFTKYYNQETAKELRNNKNYKKAQEICEKYNMTSFDKLARDNEEVMREFRKHY